MPIPARPLLWLLSPANSVPCPYQPLLLLLTLLSCPAPATAPLRPVTVPPCQLLLLLHSTCLAATRAAFDCLSPRLCLVERGRRQLAALACCSAPDQWNPLVQ